MDDFTEYKSKSQVKREMTALQVLGEQLLELTPAQISKIEMPEDLREAVLFAASLKRGEARRRHMQFIGTLMRDADPEPIRKALEEIGRGSRREALFFQELERLRDGLIAGDDELMEEIASRFPDTDRKHLRRLVLNARKEKEEGKALKSARMLFQYLRKFSKV
jgi:ribosome-associated protein